MEVKIKMARMGGSVAGVLTVSFSSGDNRILDLVECAWCLGEILRIILLLYINRQP